MTQKYFHKQEVLSTTSSVHLCLPAGSTQDRETEVFCLWGSGGKSRDWQGECEIVQTAENRSSCEQRHGEKERRRLWRQGRRRMATKMVIPLWIWLLLKTHGHKYPSGLSKLWQKKLGEKCMSEEMLWWAVGQNGRERWGCKKTNIQVPLLPWHYPIDTKTQPGPLHCFPLLSSHGWTWLKVKFVPTVDGASRHSAMQTIKADSKSPQGTALQKKKKIYIFLKNLICWHQYKHCDKMSAHILSNPRLTVKIQHWGGGDAAGTG